MIARVVVRLIVWGLLTATVASTMLALAAANSVPQTGLDEFNQTITVNHLKPPECAALNLDTIIDFERGQQKGSGKRALVLGGPNNNSINAASDSDCVLGGGGNDTLVGGKGTDILIGGPGNDHLDGGQGADVCYGGPGADTFIRCETIIDP